MVRRPRPSPREGGLPAGGCGERGSRVLGGRLAALEGKLGSFDGNLQDRLQAVEDGRHVDDGRAILFQEAEQGLARQQV